MAIVTQGDPGRAKMAGLQETIRGNLNARHMFKGPAAKIVRENGNPSYATRGGVPPPRGVNADAEGPAIPPFFSATLGMDGSVPSGEIGLATLPPVVAPTIVPWPPQPRLLDDGAGGGIPVAMSLETGINAVAGVQTARLRGPLVVQWWLVFSPTGEQTTAQQAWTRVDFSRTDGLQTFAFNDTGLPTGGAPDGISLWSAGGILDATIGGVNVPTQGWLRLISVAGTFERYGPMGSHLVIPFEDIWVKWYVQNDSAGARLQDLFLGMQRYAAPLVMGIEPIEVRVRS